MNLEVNSKENNLEFTAVLLNWKRPDNLRIIIKQLKRRGFIKEIIVWNNNPTPIKSKDLMVNQSDDIVRIINSPDNLRDHAKYLAASEAKCNHIFYQDDDWSTGTYIDAMYVCYCMDPTRLYVANGELSWVRNLYKNFYNRDEGLQSEFSFIGTGSMYPKHFAIEHLKKAKQYLTEDDFDFLDIGFSMFLNQPIVRLQVRYSGLPQENAFSSQDGFLKKKKTILQKVAKLLPNFSQEIQGLPSYMPRSVFKELILCTSYIPKECSGFVREYEIGNQQQIDDRLGAGPPRELMHNFRTNPYSDALNNETEETSKRYWRTEIAAGESWGLKVIRPKNIKLEVKVLESAQLDSEWQVKLDGNTKNITLDQLLEFEAPVNKEVMFTCLTVPVALDVNVKTI